MEAVVLWHSFDWFVGLGVHRTHPEQRHAMAVPRRTDLRRSLCNLAIRIRRVASQARAAARIGWSGRVMPHSPCRIHQRRTRPGRRGGSVQDARRSCGSGDPAVSNANCTLTAATRQGCARLHRLKRSRRGSAGVPRLAALKVLRVALPVTRTSWQRQRCGNHRQGMVCDESRLRRRLCILRRSA